MPRVPLGPGDYAPWIPFTYWSFRLMIGVGVLAAIAALWLLWMTRRGASRLSSWAVVVGAVLPFLPLAANTIGWLFTEMGRQPWIVFGLMPTAAGVSPGTSALEVAISLVGFTVIYGVLAAVEAGLLLRRIRAGLPTPAAAERERPVSFAY